MDHVMLYVVPTDRMDDDIGIVRLTFAEGGTAAPVGGAAPMIDGVISTRRGNASLWLPMIGGGPGHDTRTPFGTWELSLRTGNADQDRQIQSWFKDDKIDDILLVISYSGRTPPWPA